MFLTLPLFHFAVERRLLKNDSEGLSSVLSDEPRPGQESSSKWRAEEEGGKEYHNNSLIAKIVIACYL